MRRLIKCILCIIFLAVTVSNHKYGFINIPSEDIMTDFQFNTFTISSVFTGFSFTVLGLLTGLFSEDIKEQLKNTSIITGKSSKIVSSIVWFGISDLIAMLFIIGFIDFVNIQIKWWGIRDFLFVCEIGCIFVGLVYFLVATKGVYGLIQKIYGYDAKEIHNKKEDFEMKFRNAEKRCKSIEEK